MALVKFGGGVAGISGKIGGTVYSRNRAGSIARNWKVPTNPQTINQQATRLRFSNVASSWSELPAADQLDWDALAQTVTRVNKIGETYTPSGRQIFLEVNNSMLAAGQATIDTAPANLNPPLVGEAATTVSVLQDAGVLDSMAFATLPVVAGAVMVIDATPPLTAPKTNVTNLYRQILAAASAANPDLMPGYTTVFGSGMPDGSIVYFRVRWFKTSNGVFTTPAVYNAIAEPIP